MFDRDFYPTPRNVIDQMLSQVDLTGKVILEPLAGSGNLIDYALQYRAKEVLCCETNEDLSRICGANYTCDYMKKETEVEIYETV